MMRCPDTSRRSENTVVRRGFLKFSATMDVCRPRNPKARLAHSQFPWCTQKNTAPDLRPFSRSWSSSKPSSFRYVRKFSEVSLEDQNRSSIVRVKLQYD